MRSTSTQNTPKARRRTISASSSDSGSKYYSIQGSLTSKSKCYSSSNISESSSGEDHNSNYPDVRNTEVAGAFDIDKAICSYLLSNSSVASRQVHGEAIALQKLRISAERQQIAAQNMCNEWVANLQAHQINQDNQKSHQDYIMELHNASVQAEAIGNENYVASMTLFNKEQNERQLGLYHPSILVPSPNWEFGKRKMESHSRSDSTSTSSSEKLDNELAARVADLTLDRLQRLPHPPNCQH